MAIGLLAKRAFFDELLPTGNRRVKKCPLMTSFERKFHCLHTCAGLMLFYYYMNTVHAKMTLNIKIVFFIKNKRREMDIFIHER